MRLVYAGTGGFAMAAFEALMDSLHRPVALITQPDKPGSSPRNSSRLVGLGLKGPALKKGVPIHQPQSINDPEGIALLEKLAPDLLVVAAYGQILSQKALSIPRLGCINLHASLLPRHRGASPIAHAILAGDAETGVSVIRMTAGLDAGEVIGMVKTAIEPDETAESLENRLSIMAAQIALVAVEEIDQNTVKGIAQNPVLVTKAPRLKKEAGNIDWKKSTAEILRQIRAMQPWPTAFTFRERLGSSPNRLQIIKATPALNLDNNLDNNSPPGTLYFTESKGQDLIVKTGDGGLNLLLIQPAGKSPMSAPDYLRGNPIAIGDRLSMVFEA